MFYLVAGTITAKTFIIKRINMISTTPSEEYLFQSTNIYHNGKRISSSVALNLFGHYISDSDIYYGLPTYHEVYSIYSSHRALTTKLSAYAVNIATF